MSPTTLTLLSGISVLLLHQSLKRVIFPLIEKAHEYLRAADHRNSGGEPARGSGSR